MGLMLFEVANILIIKYWCVYSFQCQYLQIQALLWFNHQLSVLAKVAKEPQDSWCCHTIVVPCISTVLCSSTNLITLLSTSVHFQDQKLFEGTLHT